MKIIQFIIAAVIVAAIAGFIGLGFINVPVEQTQITKEIAQDKVFND